MRFAFLPSNVWMRRPARALLLATVAVLVIGAGFAAFAAGDGGGAWWSAAAVVVVGLAALIGIKLSLESTVETRRLRVHAAGSERAREHVRVEHERAIAAIGNATERTSAAQASLVARLDEEQGVRERLRQDLEDLRSGTSRSLDEAASVRTELERRQTELGDLVDRLGSRVSSLTRRLDLERLARMQLEPAPLDRVEHAETISAIRRIVESVDSGQIPVEHISDEFPDEVIGLSGRKFRTLVCELVRLLGDRGCYLEIGTYRGKTICASCVTNPSVLHLGIDNFSQFDREGTNRAVLDRLIARLGLTNIDFRDADFESFMGERTSEGIQDVAVYYFDASHDHRSQLIALMHGAKQVVPGGLMLVDDCNYTHVRAATYDFLEANPEWALLFERYTEGHPMQVDDETRRRMDDGWWNGVHVIVHDPERFVERLERFHEPDARRFFLDQHPMANCDTSRVSSRIATIYA